MVLLACAGPPDANSVAAAVFEPGTDAALVSLLGEPGDTELVLIDTATLVERQRVSVTLEADLPTTVVLSRLQPDNAYRLIRANENATDKLGWSFRTRPLPEADVDVTFVVAADIDLAFSSSVFGAMANTPAHFTLLLGDAPYADNAPGAQTLEEYRRAHRDLRRSSEMQTLLSAGAVFAIYDDHEVANNWDGALLQRNPQRVAAGVQAWDEYHPLADSTRRYRSVRWGALTELFILDTRAYRSANAAADDGAKTMLGSEQLLWLKNALLDSEAPFKLIATTVPLDFCGEDCWQAFTTERDELIDFIVTERIQTVVFLTADQHYFSVHHHRTGLKEYQFGPLARGVGPETPGDPAQVFRYYDFNYGEVRVRGGVNPRVEVRGRNQLGAEFFAEVVSPGVGTVRIESATPRSFRLSGAHAFSGVAPTSFPYAPTGRYRLRWDDEELDAAAGDLAADGTLVLP